MNLRKRLEDLEAQFHTGEIVLARADGTPRIVPVKRGEDEADLLARVMEDPDGPIAQMIMQSIGAKEPGGGHMIEMARALLLSPTEPSEVVA